MGRPCLLGVTLSVVVVAMVVATTMGTHMCCIPYQFSMYDIEISNCRYIVVLNALCLPSADVSVCS